MTVRRALAGVLDEVSRVAACLADWLDPPRPAVRPEERTASRARHPSTVGRPETLLGDVSPVDLPLAEIVPFPRAEEEPGEWIACTLGVISATRPIGAHVRFVDRKGYEVEGRIVALDGENLPLVEYRLRVDTEHHRDLSYVLPLSHPLEVRHD